MDRLVAALHVRRATHGHESVTDPKDAHFMLPKGTPFTAVGPSKVPGFKVILVDGSIYIRVPK